MLTKGLGQDKPSFVELVPSMSSSSYDSASDDVVILSPEPKRLTRVLVEFVLAMEEPEEVDDKDKLLLALQGPDD